MMTEPHGLGTRNGVAGPVLPARPPASPRVESLVELLQLRAREHPDHLGYSFLGADGAPRRQLTYRELDRQARAIGARLSGVAAPGERVLLLLPHEPAYVAAFFGCLYADLVAVPAFPPSLRRMDGRIAAIAEDADASVVLATAHTLAALAQSREQYSALRGRRWLAIEELIDSDDDGWAPTSIRRSPLAYLQYTSGSTSTPRGVMISHANALHNLEIIRQGMDGRPQTHAVGWVPLFHDLGLVAGMLTPLYLNFPLTTMSPMHFLADPVRWLRVISAVQATSSAAPNFAYDLCVQRTTPAERAALDLRAWSFAGVAGEPIRPATLERFAEAFAVSGFRREAFWPAFGLAESTLAVTIGVLPGQPLARPFDRSALEQGEAIPATPGDGDSVRVLATSGRWLRDGEVAIVDPASGVRLPPGRIGEIWCKSASVGQGYWNRPDDSAALFQARLADCGEGPFLRTGDLGFVHDSELFVTGRLKDLIVVRGRNHYPQDFEHSAERSHAEVRSNCVAAVGVERNDEEEVIVVAEVRRRSWPEQDTLPGIADAIRTALAADHQMEPSVVTLVGPGSLPRTSSGKLRRGLIRQTWLDGGFTALHTWERPGNRLVPGTRPIASRGDRIAGRLASKLLDCISQTVGSRPRAISVDDRVFGLGLDSLGLVQLMLVIEEQFGLPLPFGQIEDNPTLQELAARLSGAQVGTGQPVDLWTEAVLDAEIRPPMGLASPADRAQAILLTGATGLLGAYLLRELLDRTAADIFCLVRAPDEPTAHERLRQALSRYGVWDDRAAARIRPLLGDLSRPLLGLGPDRFAELAATLDAIYHNGAWLNFVHGYHHLKMVNVDGTREILRLACHGRAKAVHYVSTASVFYGTAYDGQLIGESVPLGAPDGLDLGYVQSKWVAEQLVWQAARRGLAVNVYRPGWIFGDSRTGRANCDDFFGRVVRGCIQLGAAPRLEYVWRGAPVDDVAGAIAALATDSGVSGRAFNLSAPSGVPWERVVQWIAEAGYQLDLVPYEDWLARLRGSSENALLPLLPFFAERPASQQKTLVQRNAERNLAKLDGTAARRALCAGMAVCRALNQDLLNRYLRSYAATGLLTS